ncbi:MAG: glycosyltransferase family 4 protein [Chloroflexi bacterium]|nr:glycosyltransferase family 4 protein [Chloroflexota bacterium]
MSVNTKLLLIGPLPPPIGGVRVLFQQLADDISTRDDINVQIINLPAQQGVSVTGLGKLTHILGMTIWSIPKVDVVSLQPTARTTFTLGPIVWFLCRLFGKKCMLRKFGGVFEKDYERMPGIVRWLARKTVLNMDLLLVETQALVNYFSDLTDKPVVWYPNSRPLPAKTNGRGTAVSPNLPRFVFLGHVKRTKGIQEIIDAAAQIDEPINVDIYGPIHDPDLEDMAFFADCYKGVILSQQVAATLQAYDVLLLPTYHKGEGYPGVILEAYCNGLPVITTEWNAIPEIVDEGSGILIQPKDTDALRQAMLKLIHNPAEVARLKAGAIKKAGEFSSEYWSNKFVEYVLDLAQQN